VLQAQALKSLTANTERNLYSSAGESFAAWVPTLSIHFEELLSRDHGNFEE
jgi:hypothetical protein